MNWLKRIYKEKPIWARIIVGIGSIYLIGFGWWLGQLTGKESFDQALYDSIFWPYITIDFVKFVFGIY